jgi:tetraacyldisaccharide 4'-kinase
LTTPHAFAPRPGPTGWRAALEQRIRQLWFAPRGLADTLIGLALRPLGSLLGAIAAQRREQIAHDKLTPRSFGEPAVVIVGNLLVGGTGKTPLIIALAKSLTARGWRVGVIARGHGSTDQVARNAPRLVRRDGATIDFGDEPILIAQETGLPVVVGRDRGAALRRLSALAALDVVLSDDGLQHVGLRRDIELAVFDSRGTGNGRCLPAGPLREPLSDALLLDAIVLSGSATPTPIAHSRIFRFQTLMTRFTTLDDSQRWEIGEFAAQMQGLSLDAVAGIGAPERFFGQLAGLGIEARCWPMADHAPIDEAWLAALPGRWLIMTAKDAVRCVGFDDALRSRCVVLHIEAVPEAALIDWLEDRLRG